MESFIILGILIVALFLITWNKIEQAADEGYYDDPSNDLNQRRNKK